LACLRILRRPLAAAMAIFIDMGSTTTDVVPVIDGRRGGTRLYGSQRLAAGELVYTACAQLYHGVRRPRAVQRLWNAVDQRKFRETWPMFTAFSAVCRGRPT